MRLEILQFEWNHNLKYDKRVDFCNILNGPPATIVPRLGRDNACFSIMTDWNRLESANCHLLTGPEPSTATAGGAAAAAVSVVQVLQLH